MRVANKTIYDGAIRSLALTSSNMFDANEIVTTSKNINKLSDDPVGIVSVLNLRSSISNIEQMDRNVVMGESWLNASESALTQINDILTSAKAMTVSMSSANVSDSQRTNNANLIGGYLEEIVALANSSIGGRYLFGGTNTDTAPFELSADGTQVTYAGNDTPFSISIGKDTVIEVGKDGEDVFGENWDDSNIFKTLIDLKADLESNNISGIQSAMSNLDTHMESINGTISDIAGKSIRLDVKSEIISDLELSYTDRISSLEDADLAEAVIDLKAKELAYNAALSSSAKIMQMSLVNFL